MKGAKTSELLLVWDTETTGLPMHEDAALALQPRLIEFGAALVSLESCEVVEEFSLLINPGPGVQLEPIITKITGLVDADLVGQPTLAERVDALQAIFDRAAAMVCHNTPFDKGVTANDLRRCGRLEGWRWPAREYCTVGIYTPDWGRNPKLIELYEERFGPHKQTHRGLEDVHMLVEIIRHDRLHEVMR